MPTRAVEEIGRVLRTGGQARVQMPTRYGLRCLYHQARRGFTDGDGFDVRYWRAGDLSRLFTDRIGQSRLEVDGYFGIGLQQTDAHLMTGARRAVLRASKAMTALSRRLPWLVKRRRQRLRAGDESMSISNLERRVLVITHFPSPYQVELFNEMERLRPGGVEGVVPVSEGAQRAAGKASRPHTSMPISTRGRLASRWRARSSRPSSWCSTTTTIARASQLIRARDRDRTAVVFLGRASGLSVPVAGTRRAAWPAGRLARRRSSRSGASGHGRSTLIVRSSVTSRAYLTCRTIPTSIAFSVARPIFSQRAFYVPVFRCPVASQGRRPPGPRVRRLAADHPHVRLKMMGEGDLEPRLRRLLAGTDRVEWVGFKDWDALPAVIRIRPRAVRPVAT